MLPYEIMIECSKPNFNIMDIFSKDLFVGFCLSMLGNISITANKVTAHEEKLCRLPIRSHFHCRQ